jgi:predicted MFS family arabinose efflux permease
MLYSTSSLCGRMVNEIVHDILPYMAIYGIIIIAFVVFCITGSHAYPAFNASDTIMGGVFASLLKGWQTSVMGDFDMTDYGTVLAKLIFVLFTAFGNLSEIHSSCSRPSCI